MSEVCTCWFKKCKDKVEITYFGKPLCDKHWEKLSNESPDKMKEILGVRRKKEKDDEPIQEPIQEASKESSVDKSV